MLTAGSYLALRRVPPTKNLNRALNSIALFALVFPLLQAGLFAWNTAQAENAQTTEEIQLTSTGTPPDIYYIILDGYAREDILERFYDLDNTPFLSELEARGFYIANCSQSNYAQTQLSLASSLNFNYLEALGSQFSPGNTSRVGLADRIKHNAVRQALEAAGYTIIAFDSGYEATQWEDASLFLSANVETSMTDFENLLVRTTAARILAEGVAFLDLPPDYEARDQAHRTRVLYTLENLKTLPQVQGPKLVFAHIISPHWPHVFGPDGESVHEHPDSTRGYRNQVIFLNKQLLPIIDAILQNSSQPPVIILQGDHGSIIESPQRRMSILNAYYLPDGGTSALYEKISPVNTFRILFNHYFGKQYPLLPDYSLYSTYEKPYEYQLVSNERPGCE